MKTKNKFKPTSLFILIPLFVLAGFQSNGYSQNIKLDENRQNEIQEDIIRVDTNLITIPTTVTDRNGGYIADLKQRGFSDF